MRHLHHEIIYRTRAIEKHAARTRMTAIGKALLKFQNLPESVRAPVNFANTPEQLVSMSRYAVHRFKKSF